MRRLEIDQEKKTAEMIEELKKDPGKHIKQIADRLGTSEPYARQLLKKLQKSSDPEIQKLCAKREACLWGGRELVAILKEGRLTTYRSIRTKLRENTINAGTRVKEPEELFKGLVKYCKRYQDKEIREIIVAHKKRGGWMP